MTELKTKRVRNDSGADIAVEYGGRDYRFDAGVEVEVPEDLADVAQYRHAHQGLHIVQAEAPVPRPVAVVAASPIALAAAALAAAAVPPGPPSFTCEHGDWSGNDEAAYKAHVESAHGQTPAAVVATDADPIPAGAVPAPTAESPSTEQTPATESPSSEPVKES